MHKYLTAAVLMLLALSGCGKLKKTNAAGKIGEDDPVVFFSNDDPEMNKAINKARASVDSFIAALKSPKKGQVSFSVKMRVTDGDQVEHMWVTDVSYDGAKFNGKMGNEPVNVKTVKLNQKVSVKPAEISDWMYIDNQKLVGGETIRVMRNKLSPKERVDFDKGMPFKIE